MSAKTIRLKTGYGPIRCQFDGADYIHVLFDWPRFEVRDLTINRLANPNPDVERGSTVRLVSNVKCDWKTKKQEVSSMLFRRGSLGGTRPWWPACNRAKVYLHREWIRDLKGRDWSRVWRVISKALLNAGGLKSFRRLEMDARLVTARKELERAKKQVRDANGWVVKSRKFLHAERLAARRLK